MKGQVQMSYQKQVFSKGQKLTAAHMNHIEEGIDALDKAVITKVETEDGKGLSSNDYTDIEKEKLAGIADGANKYIHPTYTAYTPWKTENLVRRPKFGEGVFVRDVGVDELGHVTHSVRGVVVLPKDLATSQTAGLVKVSETNGNNGENVQLDTYMTADGAVKAEVPVATQTDLGVMRPGSGLVAHQTFRRKEDGEIEFYYDGSVDVIKMGGWREGQQSTGRSGLVPEQFPGDNLKFLRGDGWWARVGLDAFASFPMGYEPGPPSEDDVLPVADSVTVEGAAVLAPPAEIYIVVDPTDDGSGHSELEIIIEYKAPHFPKSTSAHYNYDFVKLTGGTIDEGTIRIVNSTPIGTEITGDNTYNMIIRGVERLGGDWNIQITQNLVQPADSFKMHCNIGKIGIRYRKSLHREIASLNERIAMLEERLGRPGD
jgi:hypothetical protein